MKSNYLQFRSLWTAAWAAFFDACGADYIYRPKTYHLKDGSCYIPDFLVRNVKGRCSGDVFIEVCDRMTDEQAKKVKAFANITHVPFETCEQSDHPVLVVGALPYGYDINDIINDYKSREYSTEHKDWPDKLNFELIDGDNFGAHVGINEQGYIELFGDDCNYLEDMNDEATYEAYCKAWDEVIELMRSYPVEIAFTAEKE